MKEQQVNKQTNKRNETRTIELGLAWLDLGQKAGHGTHGKYLTKATATTTTSINI